MTASSTTAGATDVLYTLEFAIGVGNGQTVAGRGDVVIVFPAGYDVSAATFVEAASTLDGAPIAEEYASFEIDGQTLQLLDFTRVLTDEAAFVLKFDGVTNPPASGNRVISMQVFNQTPGDFANIHTNGSETIAITAPVLTTFEVTAVGSGPIGSQQVGVPFEIGVAALDELGAPFTALDDATYAVDISVLGGSAGASGLGTVDLDFSATPGTSTHTVRLTSARAAEVITVTSVDTPAVEGASNTFGVIAPPPPIDDVIVEAGETPVRVVNRRSFGFGADGSATGETTTPGGASLRVQIPAGAIEHAAGLRLEVAAVRDLSMQGRQLGSFGGAEVFASFVVRLVDAQGAPVEAAFALPVTLTFTVPAGDLPDDLGQDGLLLSFWDGSSWILVPATLTLGADGSATLVADLTHFTLFQVTGLPDGWGTFSPTPFARGITLTRWQGGGPDLFEAAVDGGAAWVTIGGEWYGFTAGAPAFANAAFIEAYPDGLPRGASVAFVR
ncbi:MAG: hypothetical protein M0R73_07205 [Dehalococcoidia bacterium]|nr:hypothetical protein [Dehalococcoidia bacterium]